MKEMIGLILLVAFYLFITEPEYLGQKWAAMTRAAQSETNDGH